MESDKDALRVAELLRTVYQDKKDEVTVRDRAVRSVASIVHQRAWTWAYKAASKGVPPGGPVLDVESKIKAGVVGDELWACGSALKQDALIMLFDAAEPEVVRKGAGFALKRMVRFGEYGAGDAVSRRLKKALEDVAAPVSVRFLIARMLFDDYAETNILSGLTRCLEDAKKANDKDTIERCHSLIASVEKTRIRAEEGMK